MRCTLAVAILVLFPLAAFAQTGDAGVTFSLAYRSPSASRRSLSSQCDASRFRLLPREVLHSFTRTELRYLFSRKFLLNAASL